MGQHLASPEPADAEVVLLLPWDFVPEADWRTGVPADRVGAAAALARAEGVAQMVARRVGARFLYLAAPVPPLTGVVTDDAALSRGIESLALGLGAMVFPAEAFSLATYVSSGCPVGAGWLGRVAEAAIDTLLATNGRARKVLVTDLDDTLWGGVVAEAGPDGIAFGPDSRGYRHFAYQTLLARLRREGVLLAAVSRNDRAVVDAPLASKRMPLAADDFVTVVASYEAKSAQIRDLARALNVGLDGIVFVDNNPLECEEVRLALPEVQVVTFPERAEELPALLDTLSRAFGQRALTVEDGERTALYRRRVEGIAPSGVAGADLTQFLAGLAMRLVIHDRSDGDRARAVQLINKTNQFNANGRRWSDAEVAAALARGARLYTATLHDRSGTHGEIIACLVEPDGAIDALVMSCRVFQRRVEEAFLVSLIARGIRPTAVSFAVTDRNEPFRRFVQDPAFQPDGDSRLVFDAERWAEAHGSALTLVDVSWN